METVPEKTCAEHSPAIAIVENVDVPVAHLLITAALLSLPGYTLATCVSEALDSGGMSRRRPSVSSMG